MIGGGPAGLATAAALRHAGITADVFEASPEFRPLGAGLGVQSNALKALNDIGVGHGLVDAGAEIRSIEMYSSSGRLLNGFPQGEVADAFGTPTLSVRRGDLHEALLAGIDPDHVHLGARCVSVEQDAGGVTARFEDGHEERGAALIGADGLHSVVLKTVIGDAPPDFSGWVGWRAICRPPTEVTEPTTAHLIVGRASAFILFPVGKGEVYWGCMRGAEAGGSDPPEGPKPGLMETLRDFPERASVLVNATEDAKIIRADLYDRIPGDIWSKGAIGLAGDSIHPTTPFVGQGAGIAIEDAVVLARELGRTDGLRDQDAIATALEAYAGRRAPRARWMVNLSRRRSALCKVRNPVTMGIRDAALRVLPGAILRKQVEQLVMHEL